VGVKGLAVSSAAVAADVGENALMDDDDDDHTHFNERCSDVLGSKNEGAS
jgi:hypothetical protein